MIFQAYLCIIPRFCRFFKGKRTVFSLICVIRSKKELTKAKKIHILKGKYIKGGRKQQMDAGSSRSADPPGTNLNGTFVFPRPEIQF